MDMQPPTSPAMTSRFLKLVVLLLAIGLVLAIAIVMVKGYQFNFKKVRLEPVGMVQIHSTPNNGEIFINQDKLAWWSSNRISATDGNYHLRVAKNKYWDWEKVLPVRSGNLYWIQARLVPKQKRIELLKAYPSIQASYASPYHVNGRRYLLNHLANNHYQLLELRADNLVETDINLADFISDLDGRELMFYDWLPGSERFLVQDRSSARRGELFLINPKDKKATFSLSSRYPEIDWSLADLRLVNNDSQLAYAWSNQKIWRLNLAKDDPALSLLDKVLTFQLVSDNILAVVEAVPETALDQARLKIYNYVTNQTTEVERIPKDQVYQLAAFHFEDGKDYLALSLGQRLRLVSGLFANLQASSVQVADDEPTTSSTATAIWTDFITKNSELNVVSQDLKSTPERLVATGDGRLLMADLGAARLGQVECQHLVAQLHALKTTDSPLGIKIVNTQLNAGDETCYLGQNWWVYDVDYHQYFSLTANISGASYVKRLSAPRLLDNQLVWENLAGIVRVKEFDGQNQHKLVPAASDYDIQLAPNDKYIYFFGYNAQEQLSLYRLQMTDL